MENLEKQLKKIFKKLHKKAERTDSMWLSQTRLDLQKHMKENPVQKTASVRSRIGSLFAKPMAVVSAILIFLLAGGGTAMAAWSAAPGDILYPIKLASEKVTIVLSANEESKAELHMKYADRRLEELEQISMDPDVARNTDSAVLDRVVENMESHIVKIGEYLETPSEPRHIAEVALAVAEFTQEQEESIKRIEMQSSEIILPILPTVRQINDDQKQKVTQTLYVAREILEENNTKDTVSNEDQAIKQIVIEKINLLEGGEREVVNTAVPVVDPKDEQVPGSGASNDEYVKEPDHSGATSADVFKQQEVESFYQDDKGSTDGDGEIEPTDNPNAVIIESNDTPETGEGASGDVTEPVVESGVADTPDDPPAESNTESVESAPIESPMENDEPDDSMETSKETVSKEEIITQESEPEQSNESDPETVGSDTNTGVTSQIVTSACYALID